MRARAGARRNAHCPCSSSRPARPGRAFQMRTLNPEPDTLKPDTARPGLRNAYSSSRHKGTRGSCSRASRAGLIEGVRGARGSCAARRPLIPPRRPPLPAASAASQPAAPGKPAKVAARPGGRRATAGRRRAEAILARRRRQEAKAVREAGRGGCWFRGSGPVTATAAGSRGGLGRWIQCMKVLCVHARARRGVCECSLPVTPVEPASRRRTTRMGLLGVKARIGAARSEGSDRGCSE